MVPVRHGPGADRGSGPVWSRTPSALRSSATRGRSAGRARQGRCKPRPLACHAVSGFSATAGRDGRPGQRPSLSDRDCPLRTAGDRCLWHAGGTAGENNDRSHVAADRLPRQPTAVKDKPPHAVPKTGSASPTTSPAASPTTSRSSRRRTPAGHGPARSCSSPAAGRLMSCTASAAWAASERDRGGFSTWSSMTRSTYAAGQGSKCMGGRSNEWDGE